MDSRFRRPTAVCWHVLPPTRKSSSPKGNRSALPIAALQSCLLTQQKHRQMHSSNLCLAPMRTVPQCSQPHAQGCGTASRARRRQTEALNAVVHHCEHFVAPPVQTSDTSEPQQTHGLRQCSEACLKEIRRAKSAKDESC